MYNQRSACLPDKIMCVLYNAFWHYLMTVSRKDIHLYSGICVWCLFKSCS